MSLFDQVLSPSFSTQTATYGFCNPAEAFAAVTLAAIATDGYVNPEEMHHLIVALKRVYLFQSYSTEVMQRMFEQLFAVLRREGVGNLFQSAKQSLPPELQESAFAVAADLILGDRSLTDSEQFRLTQLHRALNVTDEVASKIMEVMLIKHRSLRLTVSV